MHFHIDGVAFYGNISEVYFQDCFDTEDEDLSLTCSLRNNLNTQFVSRKNTAFQREIS